MKKSHQFIARVAMAVALMFVVSLNADAQLGGLVKKAKGAVKEKVKEKVNGVAGGNAATGGVATGTGSSSMEVAPKGWRYHGGKVHKFVPVDKEEIKKFLELNATPERAAVYAYYNLSPTETIDNAAKLDYESVASDFVRLLWNVYDVEGSLAGMTEEVWMQQLEKQLPEKINHAAAYNLEPVEVADYFDAELQRVKALFHDKNFPNEAKLAGTDVSSWLKERMDGRAEFKYGLNELKDNGSNPKLKQQFEAKVKSQFSPDRVIAVYLVSNFWRGLPCRTMPEYGEAWSSVQEKPLKAYYVKGGKYYYVKGGFRQGIKTEDVAGSGKPIENYNPGLETPIEIPADVAKKYFK